MIEIGTVDPSIATNTTGNFGKKIRHPHLILKNTLTNHITKSTRRLVHNCRRVSLSSKIYIKVNVPISKVPKKFNMTKKAINESPLGCSMKKKSRN